MKIKDFCEKDQEAFKKWVERSPKTDDGTVLKLGSPYPLLCPTCQKKMLIEAVYEDIRNDDTQIIKGVIKNVNNQGKETEETNG